jgi:N-acetyl-anhydromuramyl-L-alanine amidase AmpD
LARSVVVPQQPAIGCAAAGDSIATVLDPTALSDRIPTVVSVDPVLRGTDGASREPPAVVKQHDVTLVVSFTGDRAFIAESGPPLGAEPAVTFATSGDGGLHGKVLEVAASLGGAPDSRPRKPGVEVDVRREVSDARYASLRRTGGSVTMSLEPTTSDADTVTVPLPAHGRLDPVDSPHDGLHLGNRFWRPKERTSPPALPALADGDREVAFLEGVQANIYQAGVPKPVSLGAADKDGYVDLSVDGLADGEYTLAIEGDQMTFDHAGPDTPVTYANGDFKERVWLRRTFPIRIAGQRVETIDGEPVPGAKYRLLIDPVWMHASRRRAQRVPGRKVTLILLHRTDEGGPGAGDAGTDATRWQSGHGTGAHYVLARDGTLVKCADESEEIGHAGEGARTSWRGNDRVNSFSIGVEIAKQETWEPYTDKQYAALIRFLRRFRSPSRGDVDVWPTEIVGHSDIRLQDPEEGKEPDRLGGRNDPGLAFDWTRLERRHLGLRRYDQEAGALFDEWPDPPAEVVKERDHFNGLPKIERQARGHGFRGLTCEASTKTWQSEVQQAVRRYDTRYPLGTDASKIRDAVRDALERIGYYAPSTGDREIFAASLKAFRSHFFSGPRRTHFQNKVDRPDRDKGETWTSINPLVWSTEEERSGTTPTDQWKLTVIWALEVAKYVDYMRAHAGAEAAWQDALHDEQNERDPATKP